MQLQLSDTQIKIEGGTWPWITVHSGGSTAQVCLSPEEKQRLMESLDCDGQWLNESCAYVQDYGVIVVSHSRNLMVWAVEGLVIHAATPAERAQLAQALAHIPEEPGE